MSDQKHGVAVQGRLIPFPASISPEARASLERQVNDDGVPLNALYAMPLPDDYAGWMKVKAAADGLCGCSQGPRRYIAGKRRGYPDRRRHSPYRDARNRA
ncbi:hypothetical protein ACBY01_11170 [Sphingomonas sp. ac-8]|uniref:hypothetical protein n=1 Tax=Sphingomonas sp. ac-8 TaxID=3242977 RepID=UPI003A80A4E5